jgi:tight adherence protein B
MYTMIGILTFVACILVIELFSYSFRILRHPDRNRIRRRLRTISLDPDGERDSSVLKKDILSANPTLNRVLSAISLARWAHRFLAQANIQCTVGSFILIVIALLLGGFLIGMMMTRNGAVSAVIALGMALVPFIHAKLKKARRLQKFERQLPEALDLVARALKAGHAFSSGMQLAADEFDDPLGPEFQKTMDEINFGMSVSDALKNLSMRVDCPDVRYFIVSVLVQRETGGNLAEIIENLACLIRERFKLRGRIRVLAAEGKLSAVILIAIPFFVVLVLRLFNPNYIATLLEDPLGKGIAVVAAILMGAGVLVMRRMIDIKI